MKLAFTDALLNSLPLRIFNSLITYLHRQNPKVFHLRYNLEPLTKETVRFSHRLHLPTIHRRSHRERFYAVFEQLDPLEGAILLLRSFRNHKGPHSSKIDRLLCKAHHTHQLERKKFPPLTYTCILRIPSYSSLSNTASKLQVFDRNCFSGVADNDKRFRVGRNGVLLEYKTMVCLFPSWISTRANNYEDNDSQRRRYQPILHEMLGKTVAANPSLEFRYCPVETCSRFQEAIK